MSFAFINSIDRSTTFLFESNCYGKPKEKPILIVTKKNIFTVICIASVLFSECSLSPRYTRSPQKKNGHGAVVKRGHVKFNGTASETFQKVGLASYYGSKFDGRKTASGEIFSNSRLTAAHPSLPFGTRVKVTCLANNRSVVVRINDRGPFASKKRIIDLSQSAARELGIIKKGVARVSIEIVE